MDEEASFTFISVGYMHNGQEVTIDFDSMRAHCRPERVGDLLDDLTVLCEDVLAGRHPEDPGRPPLTPSEGRRDRRRGHCRADRGRVPWLEAWQGIDRLWHARIRGAAPIRSAAA